MVNFTQQEIMTKISELLIEQLEVEKSEITLESNIRNSLGADSYDIIMLQIKIDDTFGIATGDEEINKVANVQDLVNLVENKLQK